jgi:predicted TIM-barrel fold metal-dependent hydrolase
MTEEPPLEPERPIIDPHLHFWDIPADPASGRTGQRFLLPEAAEAVAASGHRITHSVFVECHAMHRAEGPEALRPVGETEFVVGQAAMSASGGYGPARLGHRIVGTANLLLGGAVAPVLEAHVAAGAGRFRGIRMATAWSAAGMFGMPPVPDGDGVMMRPAFREGAAILARMGLSLDVWCFHSQLGEVAALADALPDLTIVLDHVGTPESRADETRAQWAAALAELARRPNVTIKLGGLGMDLSRMVGSHFRCAPSAVLAEEWRPWLETCIALFGPERAMFESNFPPDEAAGSYCATWNAFKRIAAGASEAEKDALFRRTAARVYRIDLEE